DTAFLAYDHVSPFFCRGVDRAAVKQAVSDFLKSQRRIDTVWISEPLGEAAWAREQGYDQLLSLPMVHVELDGCQTLDEYAARLSKKRRRNFRHDREQFAAAGAVVERHEGPLNPDQAPTDSERAARKKLLAELLKCLAASAAHSELTVPYNNVLTDAEAFADQRQTVLVARVDGRAVGFMSFLTDGDRLLQCHGGLDYQRSHEVLAYHNLIYAGIELAIERGCRVMSMGPLNNETKRRAGTHLRPMVSSLWNRWPADRLIARKLFIKNFEVFTGEVPADEQTADAPETK
ncbi:MAG: GNAT family N-acetyltransferase, partial [Planctomycetota bacterium]